MTEDYENEQSTGLMEIDAELEKEAKQIATALSGSPFVSFKGGVFTFPDGTVIKPPMSVAIVGAVMSKQLWNLPYDDSDSTTQRGIVCAAISGPSLDDPERPFEDAPQIPDNIGLCAKCPENRWERNPSGKRVKVGECKDGPLWAFMAPDLATEQVFLIRGSATGIKEARAVMQEAKTKFKHPIKALFKMDGEPTRRGAQRLAVRVEGPNPRYAEHYHFLSRANEMLSQPPRWFSGEDVTPADVAKARSEAAAPSGASKRRSRTAA